MSFNRSKEEKVKVFYYREVWKTFVEEYKAPSPDVLKENFLERRRPEIDIFLTPQEAWYKSRCETSVQFHQPCVVEAIAIVKSMRTAGGDILYACIDNIEDIVGFRVSETGDLYQNPHFQATKKREEAQIQAQAQAQAKLEAKTLLLSVNSKDKESSLKPLTLSPCFDKMTVYRGIIPFITSSKLLIMAKNPQSAAQEKDSNVTEQAKQTLGKRKRK